mgnify:FL=1|tara:strand:- start:1570 stop:2547 length:978 start_codon:yes stop_codon:yes gene_type:complete
MKQKILITGCLGFIGYHITLKLLKNSKFNVLGVDNINDYYDIQLKKDRLKNIKLNSTNFTFQKLDITNNNQLKRLFKKNKITHIIHLAAQAGVRNSIKSPRVYLENNINGFFNVLEMSRMHNIKHLIFASTSSVYGDAKSFPLTEEDNTDKPLSFYAATKKSNEVMAYAYSNIYKIPITGLRFFTVYGPYGRPDMSLFKFTKGIIDKNSISLFNKGNHVRDFTYIDDIVDGISLVINKPPIGKVPFDIFNLASGNPKSLKFFLNAIENKLNIKARKKLYGMQKGDVYKTHASIRKIIKKFKYNPKFDIVSGISDFVDWYKKYFNK